MNDLYQGVNRMLPPGNPEDVERQMIGFVKKATHMTIRIEAHTGGWMVYLPNGDYAWQPSKQFAEAFARQWTATQAAQLAPDANCFTLPNGDCIGTSCMHDVKKN
jgi:hypothetical protein